MDEAWIGEVTVQSCDRSFDPTGLTRQQLAIYASGDRTAVLARVMAPALVVHGEADPLIQLPGGQVTAAALPDVDLLVLSDMGTTCSAESGRRWWRRSAGSPTI